MSTFTIKLSSDQLRMIKSIIGEDGDVAEWLQQKAEAILLQKVLETEKETPTATHPWDD